MKYLWVLLICFPHQLLSATYRITGITSSIEAVQHLLDQCAPFDTIRINSGTYKWHDLIVNKPLYIEGDGQPILDGENLGNVITVKSSDVTLKNIHVKNSAPSSYSDPAGIKIESGENIQVLDCIIENCLFGIYYSDVSGGLIRGNHIYSNKTTETASGNGIHLWKCKDIAIRGNIINGHRDGIYLEFTTHSVISGNISQNNIRYGLHFMFSHQDSYIKNTFRNNGAGVAVMYTKGVKMVENNFIDNSGTSSYGLLLKDITDSKIIRNHFTNNTCAITMEECNRINVQKNTFERNGWAMRIQASCSDNNIQWNNFFGNTFDITTNGTLVMNTFNSNYWDKYTGYDLNRDQTGDVPYHPVSMYAVIVDQIPVAMILYRSFVVTLLEQMEKIIPSITPAQLIDRTPRMKPVAI
ncbi:MAG TPA: nitrous oxide reductase family maturation protein NosD [Bacteroidia bacterium]|nr:nitrous oxide reductase family maturation protein NosD [Bacteroidia bacterium]